MDRRKIYGLISVACCLIFAILGVLMCYAMGSSLSAGLENIEGYGGLVAGLLLTILYAVFLAYMFLGVLSLIFQLLHFCIRRRWTGVVCLVLDAIYFHLHGASLLPSVLDRDRSIGFVAFLGLLTALSFLALIMNAKSLSALENPS